MGTIREEFSVSADDLVKKVKELIQETNVTRIIVKNEEGKPFSKSQPRSRS